MSEVKTAISLDAELFEMVNKLAGQLRISRSRLFTVVVLDYLKKLENQSLLAQLNSAYSGGFDPEELAVSKAMKSKHRKKLGQEKCNLNLKNC